MNNVVALAPLAAVVALLVAFAVLERRSRRRRRGAYRLVVALKPLARLVTDDRT